MKKIYLLVLSLTMSISLIAGCQQLETIKPFYSNNPDRDVQSGRYVPKIDNFIIILDCSSSMGTAYRGMEDTEHSKFWVAKDIIRRMNNTIPEIDINAAIQTFGHGILQPIEQTETVYGPTTYSRSGLEQSLDKIMIPAEGNSPAGLAIEGINEIMETAQGSSAIIVISDGENLENGPLMKVRALKDKYGNRSCLYTIWVGNKIEGRIFMEQLAAGMDCGFSKPADDISTSEEMSDFVREVFLTMERYSDSDRDGVYDYLDNCPDTPTGVEVDGTGCSKLSRMDSDRDGVSDDRDKCPDTPLGVEVDLSGCPDRLDSDGDGVADGSDQCPDTPGGAIVDDRGCWVAMNVQFDYRKWDIKPQFNTNLDNIVKILKNNPGLNIRIEGHTDNVGPKEYNINLSKKRAQSIKDYLVKEGIGQSRITTNGLGYSQPIADNDTPEGRALNRRTELVPVK